MEYDILFTLPTYSLGIDCLGMSFVLINHLAERDRLLTVKRDSKKEFCNVFSIVKRVF